MKPYHYVSPRDADALRSAQGLSANLLMAAASWEERTSARYEAFYSTLDQPYTYGKGVGTRTYHPKPMPEWLETAQAELRVIFQAPFQLCFINRYDTQFQHLGWHADDSPEQDHETSPIVVQSFGAEREIWTKPYGGGPETVDKILLEDGSIFVMHPGMQQTHVHRIPKHPQPCGPRISLTWRSLK